MSGFAIGWSEVVEILKLAAYFGRDFLALLTLAMAGLALFAVVLRSRELAARTIVSGTFVWPISFASFLFPSDFAPSDRGFLFDNGITFAILATALGLWVVVYALLFLRAWQGSQ